MVLLSTAGSWSPGAASVHSVGENRHHLGDFDRVNNASPLSVYYSGDTAFVQPPLTTHGQTVSLGNTTTNFTNQPLSPALDLFDPSAGKLISVAVSHSATIQSSITSQNFSPSSPTVITATASASYQIDGLNQPISQPTKTFTTQPMAAGVFGSATDTVTFPPFVFTDSATTTFTDPASLAFYTASSGRSAVMLTMSATATAAASAPNGNMLTTADSSALATVTVTYAYLPASLPASHPTMTSVGLIDVHHQQTQIIVGFNGSLDPNKANNPSNYSVITQSGKTIPIKSALYNPATNSVTLVPAQHLNAHGRPVLPAIRRFSLLRWLGSHVGSSVESHAHQIRHRPNGLGPHRS
jgi:hypothetical protein